MSRLNGSRPYGEKVGEINFPYNEKRPASIRTGEDLLYQTIEEILATYGRKAVLATFIKDGSGRSMTEVFAQPPFDTAQAAEVGHTIRKSWQEKLEASIDARGLEDISQAGGFKVTQATELYHLEPSQEGCRINALPLPDLSLDTIADSSQVAL